MLIKKFFFIGFLLVVPWFVAGCWGALNAASFEYVPGGNAEIGETLIQEHGCGACHDIPGINSANGQVGPPLEKWAERVYIAGNLPNNPENLIRWLMNPQDIEPGTAMPNLEITEQEARDISAYLYTLR